MTANRYLTLAASDREILNKLWSRYDQTLSREDRARIEDAVAACRTPPAEGQSVLSRGHYPADKIR